MSGDLKLPEELPTSAEPNRVLRSNESTAKLAELLPPKFLRPDLRVEKFSARVSSTEVVLPTADGGTVVVSRDVRRLEHNGHTVVLRSLTPQARLFRRRLTNSIVIGISLLMLLMAFWWLSQSS